MYESSMGFPSKASFLASSSKKLSALGIRSELDESPSTISYKIRAAETPKIPYMAIWGKREAESKTLPLRKHGRKELRSLTIKDLVKIIQNERTFI